MLTLFRRVCVLRGCDSRSRVRSTSWHVEQRPRRWSSNTMDHVRGRDKKRGFSGTDVDSVPKRSKFGEESNGESRTKIVLTDAQIIKEASRRGNLKYYNKFINEAAKRKQLGLALELFSDLRKQNLQADVFTYTCLLNACVRSNNVVKAQEVFESMKNAKVDANEVTFTTMIKGFAQSQQCGKAFEMIQTMREMKLKPNIRTYNAVFRGCFRNGDTDVAVKAFQDMKHHSIQPDATVMQMMIKIYAQAVMIDQAMGVLDTAENKIKVPIDPSVYLLLASMSCLAGVRLKMIESLAAKFDAAVKEAQEQPATNGTGGARLSSVASVELEFERAQLQSLIDKRTKGTWAKPPLDAVKDGPRKSPFTYFVVPLENPTESKLYQDFSAAKKGSSRPKKLEICAGAGDWMIDRALVDKEADWYASEIRFDRVHEIWRKKYMREADNVYIIAGDAVDAVKQIPDACLKEVYINFPEPPHSEDLSDALINRDLLLQIHRILLPRGELTIASDDTVYVKSISDLVREIGSDHFKSSLPGVKNGLTNDLSGYGASFFDRLWEARGRSDRSLLKVYKRKKPLE